MNKSYKRLSRRLIYDGYIIQLVKDRILLKQNPPKETSRELVLHPGAVVVLPVLPKKRILLLRQFRYAAFGHMWEIPAGTREKNENPLTCAKREIEEETGYKARKWQLLTKFMPAPGISNEWMHLYKAEDLYEGRQNLDHDEWLEVKEFSFAEALDMVRRGKIQDAKTIVGLLWLQSFS